MSLADASREALGWEMILSAAKAQVDKARARLLDEMVQAGSLKQGVKEGSAHWGTASLTGGDVVPMVTDADALLRWTVEKRPDMLTYVLRESWVNYLKASAWENGGRAVDPETGEVVPGVELRSRPVGLRINLTREAKEGAAALVQDMALGNLQIGPKE